MSHFTQVETQFRDIEALKDACQELGLPVVANSIARGYDGNQIAGEFVIGLSGPYDAALNRRPDGTYAVTADLWQGHVEKELGTGFCRLRQLYGVHKTTREARTRGYTVQRRSQPNGGITLSLCRA